MTDIYSEKELVKLSQYRPREFKEFIKQYSVRDNLNFLRKLTESIYRYSKNNKMDVHIQWNLVCLSEMIRRVVWNPIYEDFQQMIKTKYPLLRGLQLKRLAQDKTEKTIKKFTF